MVYASRYGSTREVATGIAAGLGWPYYLAALITVGLLVYEHSLIAPDDLSRVNVAFFNMNSYIAITLLAGVVLAIKNARKPCCLRRQ